MIIIKQGNSYDISFTYKNLSNTTIAKAVKAIVTVGADLTINSITSSVGSAGPAANEYTIGSSLPQAQHEIIVNVTVVNEAQYLPVTLVVTTSNTETITSNNTITKNLVSDLGGILCSDISDCSGTGGGTGPADNLGNHTATKNLNMDGNAVVGEEIPVKNSYTQALADLGVNRKFRYSEQNLDLVPSPNDSTIGYTN